MIGTTLAHYKITSHLGTGGMGEVYQATDTKLGRSVAIKLIPVAFAQDAERTVRFEREARVLASLNHPGIAAIYGVEASGGRKFLVMELVPGETLAEKISRGAIPIEEALSIATQTSRALEAAHKKGVVHRDLKPSNIKVTADGNVKVLDFGLAIGFVEKTSDMNPDDSPTLVSATSPGMILGTAAYMSPEQALGKPVDTRSDIFAFGVVLYEMLTGKRPFQGESTLSVLASVLESTPEPLHHLRKEIPDSIDRIVVRCLQKKPGERYGSASELSHALLSAQSTLQNSSKTKTYLLARVGVIAVGVAILLAIAGISWQSYRKSAHLRWVEETAVPQITRFIQEDRGLAALKVFREAEQYAPASRSLIKLAEGVAARPVSFETTPAGAEIYISDYTAATGDDLSQWQLLGKAPLMSDQIPTWGYYRVRAVKDGYAPTDQTFGGSVAVHLTLVEKNSAPPGMVQVPATAATQTAPSVALPEFWMDRYEVTNREFKQFVDGGGYRKPEYWKQPFVKDGRTLSWQQAMEEFRDRTSRRGPANWQLGTYPDGTADTPVGGISWYEALAYAEFAGKSLPTAYEWNVAAGIGVNSDILQLSNFDGKMVAAISTHRGMSPFGSFDMAGNIKEWTVNASGDKRYILGGAWDEPQYQFSNPDAREPFARNETFGFRCVRRVTPPPRESFAELSLALTPTKASVQSVSEETFRVFLALHAYEKSALESRVERVDDSSPYWRRETVSFKAAYGNERVIAHIFLPRNAAPPYQVVAVVGGSTITDVLRRVEDFDYPYEFILRSGRAVIIPALFGTLERGPSSFILPANQERERGLKWSMDLGRSIDYLETRTDVDTHKLGFYGISFGAPHGVRMVAVDGRFKAAVLLSGGLMNQPVEMDSRNYAPRIHFPVLMLNGRDDFVFPLETAQVPLFKAFGTKEPDKKHILYDGGHRNLVTRPDLIGEILNWFDRHLGPVNPAP